MWVTPEQVLSNIHRDTWGTTVAQVGEGGRRALIITDDHHSNITLCSQSVLQSTGTEASATLKEKMKHKSRHLARKGREEGEI